jgi:multicomponent Na+:H+ antiporter subunit G
MADFLVNLAALWEILRHPMGAAACLAGGIICVISSIGVLRFPDFYTRLHAASVTDTGGAALILIGMALMAPGWIVLVKLFCIFVFLFLTSPTGSHALANAAHTAGLQPLIGTQAQSGIGDKA